MTLPGRPVIAIDLSHATAVSDETIDTLASLKELRILTLVGTRIGDAALARFADFPKLETLDLSFTKVTDKGIQKLSALKSVVDLSLNGTNISDAGVDHVLAIPQLKTLNILHTRISGRTLKNMAAANRLRKLSINSKALTEADFRHLSGTSLEGLNLPGNPWLTKECIGHIAKIRTLRTLDLSYTLCADDWIDSLGAFSELSELTISTTLISDEGERRLRRLLPKTKITRD
jgi:Leucine-rich repeat (LRR) protein